jgi:hypothetical protein
MTTDLAVLPSIEPARDLAPLGRERPALGAVFGVASQSSGSVMLDASLGALVGYVGAPSVKGRWKYAAGGAIATGLAGLTGLLCTLGVVYLKRGSSK